MHTCLCTVANHIDIPLTILWWYWKLGDISKSTVHMKNALTLQHMRDRVEWCESFVGASGTYKDMYEYVHIDEKWFYLGQVKKYFYMLPEEAEPHFTCQNKKFLTKVMFICAVVRPQ